MKKRIAVFLFSLVLLFSLFACEMKSDFEESGEESSEVSQEISGGEQNARVMFFRGEEFDIELAKKKFKTAARIDSLKDYTSEYSKYNSYIHFQSLNENEKLVYKAIEYALYNCHRHIVFDVSLLKDSKYTVINILEILAADTPLLEQNLWRTYRDVEFTVDSEDGEQETYKGTLLSCDNFAFTVFGKKEDAIKLAEDIVKGMPEGLSELATARYLYKQLGEGTNYDIGEEGIQNYLYDALAGTSTHCDGFANAYSLLCNMVGLQCYEKIWHPVSGDGHTWNTVRINNSWYNVDVSMIADTKDQDSSVYFWYGFGFKDASYRATHKYQDIAPVCYGWISVKD